MTFSRFFIDRPIFATVITVFVIIIGGLAYFALPVSQYPEVVPPTIEVTAAYPGASPEIIAQTVATPLEQEINGVENMLYMYSQSTSDGQMNLTITFKLGTDLDMAQVLVQNRVATAEPRLPEEVRRIGVTTVKNSPDMLMAIHLISPDETYDQLYIANYATLQVRDIMQRLDGVGSVRIYGASDYSMRVWLDPERIAALNMTSAEVVAALREQNVQVAGGIIGQPPMDEPRAFQESIQLQGRLMEPEQFANIVVKTGADGRLVRVRDVARVELGARDYVTKSYMSGEPAVVLLVYQRPGSNALSTADSVKSTMAELAQDFPEGLEYRIIYNPTDYIEQSIDELLVTILQAVGLVVLVVLVFLQSVRATIVPVVGIPFSLIGTFAVMAAAGFSINTLTLFGLVLAVGNVVDDGIVVVESVERKISQGLSPREATIQTMDEVGAAIVAIALVLPAVFIPTAFIGGISGQFYKQFAITIAAATFISPINSLTLAPALCALVLKSKSDRESGNLFARLGSALSNGFNAGMDALSGVYSSLIRGITRVGWLMLLVYAGLMILTGWIFQQVPTGFIPAQDQGYLITALQLPPGSSLERTEEVIRKAEDIILNTPGVANTATFAGFSGATFTNSSSAGAIFLPLDPADERAEKGLSADRILGELRGKLFAIPDAFIIAIPPPPVRGIGTAGGFSMRVQDRGGRGTAILEQATRELIAAANQEAGLSSVYTTFNTFTPQLFVDVDRTRAEMLNVPLESVFNTLSVNLGSVYVNDFNLFGRTYRVTAQADAPFRHDVEDITRLRTRSADGEMVPLSSLASVDYITGPDRMPRYNLYPTTEVDGSTSPGFSSGQSLATMERLAERVLPRGIGYEWTGLALQEKLAGNTLIYIFPLCVLFVFLTLAAQFESWALPMAVICIVPMCLLSAMSAILLRGMDNNILTQIGLIVLIALASKNAILIVEYARQLEDKGMDRFAAAVEACRLRLRPILMTAFSFILGVVPLVIATGAGFEMRRVLGTAVFFGMIGVTAFGLIFTPVFYVVIRGLVERFRKLTA